MKIKAFTCVYGQVGDMLDIATDNFLLDLIHYGIFVVTFFKNLVMWREINLGELVLTMNF